MPKKIDSKDCQILKLNSFSERLFITVKNIWLIGFLMLLLKKNVSELTIDFWNNTIVPNELEIKPIINQLPRLKDTVWRTLKSQNFEIDFINIGTLKIKTGKTGYK